MSKYKGKPFRSNNDRVEKTINSIIDFISITLSNISLICKHYKTVIIGILAGIVIAFIVILVSDFKNVKALANFQPNITTKIYDKNGILISEIFRQKREVIPFEKIPKNMINAIITMEDNEYYEHFGLNPKGIVRALFINIFSGQIRQGGSTITQQLSKILLTSRKRNLYRKIKEAFISLMIEAKYSKDEILTMYLNQIFLGHGTYGIESAAKFYFKKHIWELSLAESSLLATLPSAPNRLSPIKHPKKSMGRHKIALAKMVEMGFISVAEAEKAYMDFWPEYLQYIGKISPSINTWNNRIDRAPWFTEYIRRKLIKKYGEKVVYLDGLNVYTTLDLKKQTAGQIILKKALEKQTAVSESLAFKNDDFLMEKYSEEISLLSYIIDVAPFRKSGSARNMKINAHIRSNIIEELEGLNLLAGLDTIDEFIEKFRTTFSDDKDLQKVEGCIISINQENGYIEAMIGGSEFSSINQLNRTMQSRRQPGSAIKPLLYTAAIESGKFTPSTTILDSPIVYLDKEGGDWLPENYEGEYYGFVRLRKALEKSINVISIRIADTLGISTVINYYAKLLNMNKAEAKNRINRNFSIALGSIEVSPYELTRAYAILANGGKEVIPFSIRYIKNRDGKIIENMEQQVKDQIAQKTKNGSIQIINPETAQIMISMLKSVISHGTAKLAYPNRPAGGKTGTTNNWKDAWFVGFTPQLTSGLWIGYDKLGLSLGIGQSAGGIAAPVWGKYMKEALSNEPVIGFPNYAELKQIAVCSKSGLLPSDKCKSTIKEVFIPKYIPHSECEICKNMENSNTILSQSPKENIVKRQKNNILKHIKKKRKQSFIDNIGNDLLQ